MSIHINRFVDKIKAAESRASREVTLTIIEARDLHADITKLLLALQEKNNTKSGANIIESVEIEGGTF